MGNVAFWLILIGLVVILVITNHNNQKNKNNKKIERLIESFGKRRFPTEDFKLDSDKLSGYYEYCKTNNADNYHFIDEITWNDLNLDSIFEVLNVTHSSCGEEYLYAKLHMLSASDEIPYEFYDGLSTYISDEKKRLNHQVSLSKLGKNKNYNTFILLDKLLDAKGTLAFNDIIIDILLVVSFSTIFISPGPGVLFFIAMLAVAIGTYFSRKARINEQLQAFAYLIKLIKCAKSMELDIDNDVQTLLKGSFMIPFKDGTATDPISIVLDYIRMIFHVDLILLNNKLSIISKKEKAVISLYEQIGFIDASIAVASFCESVEHYCKANFVTEDGVFEAIGLYHPLIKKPVFNDIDSKNGVLLTGSNASGKSTFLKMVGINIIFAQSFGLALASTLNLSHLLLYTSMALKDNILGEESYYVVETKSLKRICDVAGTSNNIVCIVDEVLRGTNTIERIAASAKIMQFLKEKNVLCYVATHDVELTTLLKDYFDLYYFAEEIIGGNVTFPYLIQKGVSLSGNAIKLLEVLGYDPKIVNGANQTIDEYKNNGKWELK